METSTSKANSPKRSALIIGAVALVFILILVFQMLEDPDSEYEPNLMNDRKARNEYFQTDASSPLSDAQRRRFKGLEYYEINRKFRVYATFNPNPTYQKVDIIRTGGDTVTYIQAGWLNFEYDKTKYAFIAYQPNNQSSKDLFVPFRDASSGKTTYGGGRYIDTRLVKDRPQVLLDFNAAYNPFCVYNHEYTCPIPPEENTLPFEVLAGEKDYPDKI